MKLENWVAVRFIIGNRKKVIFPFLVVVGATIVIFLSIILKGSIVNTIEKDLRTIGKNTLLVGGDTIDSTDISMLNSIPDVEYTMFIDEVYKSEDILYKGYSKRLLSKMGYDYLNDNEVILDRAQFPKEQIGDRITLPVGNQYRSFYVRDFYEEKNPLELMKVGKRVILSEEGFNKNINSQTYDKVAITFSKNIDINNYIPLVLNSLNWNRTKQIEVLELPEVFKKVNQIANILDKTLVILLGVSFFAGGFFVFNMTRSFVEQKKSDIGILRAIGMNHKKIIKIFSIINVYFVVSGITLGVILGVIALKIIEFILKLKIVVEIGEVIFILPCIIVLAIALGIYPLRKINKISIMELLK